MEGTLAILFLFGVPGLIGFSFTPMGRAITERIRHGPGGAAPADPELLAEIDQMRIELSELHERMDFAERLLARPSTQAVSGATE